MFITTTEFNNFLSFAERTCIKLTGVVNAFSSRKVTDLGMMFVANYADAYSIMYRHFGSSLVSTSVDGNGKVYIANKCDKARILCYWDVSHLTKCETRILAEYFGEDFEVIYAENQFGDLRAYFVGVLFSN